MPSLSIINPYPESIPPDLSATPATRDIQNGKSQPFLHIRSMVLQERGKKENKKLLGPTVRYSDSGDLGHTS
jgi:hypothetical protein